MKIFVSILLAALLLLLCAACAKGPAVDAPIPSPSPTPLLPGGHDQGKEAQEPSPPPEEEKKSALYPPSIFVIEAAGSWRQELAQGYYANYECELYADKLDELDNQSAGGHYTGVLWLKTTLDTGEYIKNFLQGVPVQMEFDAGAEGICDSLSLVFLTGLERDSMGGDSSFSIDSALPAREALAARGSFTAVAMDAYLSAHARGAAGESVDYENSQAADTEISYVIHIEPDPDYSMAERKVTIQLSTAEGMLGSFEGVLKRLPGYSEDMKAYTSSGKRDEMLEKHLT